MSPCSSSSTCGAISFSTNCRTASLIIFCSSVHSNMAAEPTCRRPGISGAEWRFDGRSGRLAREVDDRRLHARLGVARRSAGSGPPLGVAACRVGSPRSSAGSRPIAAQCACSTSILRRTSAGSPNRLQASACCATRRSVFFSPEPPTRIGMCACTGRGYTIASGTVIARPLKRGAPLPHMSGNSSSASSSRS